MLNLTIPVGAFRRDDGGARGGQACLHRKAARRHRGSGRRLVAEAGRAGVSLGSAPDTFLGAAGRRARHLIDAGAIGRPVTGTAFMMGRGMEHWHPNPQFYYQPGGGPVLRHGSLLPHHAGQPARAGRAGDGHDQPGQAERLVTAEGPFRDTSFKVGTPTNSLSLLEFGSGASVTFGASWDVHRHSNHPIELHGTEGSLRLPDPDTFGGTVSLSEHGARLGRLRTARDALFGALNWPYAAPDRANYRMLGVADLARAVRSGRAPRASGDLALHVLAVLEAIWLGRAPGAG